MKPLLAHVYEPHRVTYPCYVQPKLNGIRALYKSGRFQSRDQIPFPVGLLDHLAKPLVEIFGTGDSSPLLDGELYVHGWPLQRINAAVTPVRQLPTEDTVKVEYHVFDVVDYGKSFEERINIQPAIGFLRKSDVKINCVYTERVTSQQKADDAYADYVAQGYEGMMYRLGDCPYTKPKQPVALHNTYLPSLRSSFISNKDNRSRYLLKRKSWTDDEFEFLSLNETTGELGERGFQMWVKARNGSPFKVSSGLSQSELDSYLENPPIGRQIKIKYLVLSDKGIPLNATILAVL